MRGDDEDVSPFVDEAAYVVGLLRAVVVGAQQFDGGIVVEEELAAHLAVLFLSPETAAALRHADQVAARGTVVA